MTKLKIKTLLLIIICSDFFNVEFANKIQLPSLIFETVGFILMILELFFTNLSIKIESHIDKVYEKIKLSLSTSFKDLHIDSTKTILKEQGGCFLFCVIFLFIPFKDFFGWWFFLFLAAWIIPSLLMDFVDNIFTIIILIVLLPINYIIKFANSNTKENAIGGIGLILALLGILGEYYQYFASF